MADKERFEITAQGTHMNVLRLGSGEPVVLVHGYGGDTGMWYFNTGALARRHSVYAVDLPGFGRSGRVVADDPIADFTGWLLRLLEREGLSRAHIVGSSMGGGVALNFAAEHPQRVHKLVLVSPAGLGEGLNHGFLDNFVAAEEPEALRRVFGDAFADPAVFGDDMLQHMMAYKQSPGANDVLRRVKAALSGANGESLNLRDRLERVQAPTLVVWGRHDRVVPVAHAEEARRIPDARVEILEDAGHIPQVERADRFNQLVLDFLAE